METTFLTSQLSVIATVLVTLILTILLSIVITRKYFIRKTRSLLFWSLGLWFFTIGVFLEYLFATGTYSDLLIGGYLLVVAMLVELLALGSVQLIDSKIVHKVYYAFVVVTTLLLTYLLLVTPIGSQNTVITDYIVYGNLPINIVLASSLITFPAAIIIIFSAAKGYLARRDPRLLSIILGVIIVSIAGTLYIVQYPAFLYISEFVGILLLWYGFL